MLALPVLVLVGQVLASVLLSAPPLRAVAGGRPRIAVLIPAHDEALLITGTLARIAPQLLPGDRLLVVADNCRDDTAALARAAGAEVLLRSDMDRRGKGHALDHGVRHLSGDAPAIVVIVDADCDVAPGALDTVTRCCAGTGRPAQALYLLEGGAGNAAVSPAAVFAWRVRNLVRPLGMHHLGLPCHLMGTGMAIPWPLLQRLRLASGHLVEDMQMGIDLARLGAPPVFCPHALVTSRFAAGTAGAGSQRTRWEHGHIGMIVSEVPKMLLESARGLGAGLATMALDTCVPPLALLLLLLLAAALFTTLAAMLGASVWPAVLAWMLVCLFVLGVLLAWVRFARDVLPLSALLGSMSYALAKVPLYLRFLVRRQVEWVRSKRDAD
ncbi:MAG: glycosyltransferase family 2 protein [Burkholderiaceae bacterium]|nr:glycosyltransferase family 2 protein [Burkholderiaceae bacterium]